MGAKYTTNATTGYNSSPPADDGSQVAANLVKWETHKTKLADPVKTLADDINTDLVAAFDYSVRQITASDNTVAGDHMRCVEIASTVTTAVTVSLGDAATMTSVYRVFIKNSSAISQTIGRVTSGDTIDGSAANLTIPAGAGIILQTNAAANGYLVNARSGTYSESSFTATLTGCTTAPTGTVKYTKNGNVVTLDVPAFTATSNATTKSLTGAPAAVRPAAQKIFTGIGRDNGGAYSGVEIVVETTGVINFYYNFENAWTGSGGFGVRQFSITYTLA